MYFACLSAGPIGPNIFETTRMTPGKVYGCSKLKKKLVSKILRFKIFFENPRTNNIITANVFVLVLKGKREDAQRYSHKYKLK